MKKYLFLLIAVIGFLFSGCNLDESPIVSLDKKAVFSSEEGITAYSISLYDMFPHPTDQSIIEQTLVDFGCTLTIGSAYTVLHAYSENNSSGWSISDWGSLRNINYMIANCTDPAVPEVVRNNFIGLARFFRALFYYNMVVRFGDVPWIDRPLDPVLDSDILYAPRDSREFVMEKVYEDLMFACEHITRTTDAIQCSMVSKWAAYALASRICLFEGTFRKYHGLNLETSADVWLKRAEDASSVVMQNSGKSLNNNYRALFTSDNPPANETILALASSDALGQRHAANWRWTSETYGSGLNLIRAFVNTYLQKDGTPYTNRQGWQYEDWYEEFQNRDERLYATLRYPGYLREGTIALPVFHGYARLGYQPMKLSVDVTIGDNQTLSTHAVQLIRYGEVLLNYAEAKAELGTITDADWNNTIGALRRRAGITGGTTAKPTTVDNYLKNTYFPEISDPVILEVRRERAIELIFEGRRFDDLRRWKHGELLKMSWRGMYIPGVNVPLDVDRNGTHDILYYTDDAGLAAGLTLTTNKDIPRKLVSTEASDGVIQIIPAGNGTGYYLAWFTQEESRRVWGLKQYLFPIPVSALNRNNNLTQNPGWENGATNDGN